MNKSFSERRLNKLKLDDKLIVLNDVAEFGAPLESVPLLRHSEIVTVSDIERCPFDLVVKSSIGEYVGVFIEEVSLLTSSGDIDLTTLDLGKELSNSNCVTTI